MDHLKKLLKNFPTELISIIIEYAQLLHKENLLYALLYSPNYEISIPLLKTKQRRTYLHVATNVQEKFWKSEMDMTLYIRLPLIKKRSLTVDNISRYLEQQYILVFLGPDVYRLNHEFAINVSYDDFFTMIITNDLPGRFERYCDFQRMERQVRRYLVKLDLETYQKHPLISQVSDELPNMNYEY